MLDLRDSRYVSCVRALFYVMQPSSASSLVMHNAAFFIADLFCRDPDDSAVANMHWTLDTELDRSGIQRTIINVLLESATPTPAFGR